MAAPDPPEGLWLDITGCTAAFASEAELVGDLAAWLERNGIPCRVAVAGTPGIAWALARAAGHDGMGLADLPITCLRLDAGVVTGLRRFGAAHSEGSAAHSSRADHGAVWRHAGTAAEPGVGRVEEAIDWPRPPVEWHERPAFVEPIGTPEDLARALARLAERLCVRLGEQDKGSALSLGSFGWMRLCRGLW